MGASVQKLGSEDRVGIRCKAKVLKTEHKSEVRSANGNVVRYMAEISR